MSLFETVLKRVLAEGTHTESSIHGPDHWFRVERNGRYLAQFESFNLTVVGLFAILHDSMRLDDGFDPEHGPRAAEFTRSLRGGLIDIPKEDFDGLVYAIKWHTHGKQAPSLTIGACWDSDRLDLPRVGIRPDPAYLFTTTARELADSGDLSALNKVKLRDF